MFVLFDKNIKKNGGELVKKEKWVKVIIKGMEYKISNYGNIIGKRGK